jgi:hydroxymethylglutaryl-CoA synthase
MPCSKSEYIIDCVLYAFSRLPRETRLDSQWPFSMIHSILHSCIYLSHSLSSSSSSSIIDHYRYDIDPTQVGRLEVGTETLVDKSKSTKTVLMDLFTPHNNTDVEGATIVNACYGGTAALLNAFLWVESDGWDGRYAIVVAADIATYARGPARPTCGAGAVAVLVGRDAPLQFAPKERATHASNVWDFFKPDHTVEYPTVDGALSQTCYYQALEDVYARFVDKMEKNSTQSGPTTSEQSFTAESPDYFVFHAPYNKLVQKSFARLYLLDARRRQEERSTEEEKKEKDAAAPDHEDSLLQEWLTKPIEETYNDRALDGVLKKLSAATFEERLYDANRASQLVGNTYTASVFLGLASLIDRAGSRGELTPGKSMVVFSYGSGALATMYRLTV